MSIEWYRSLLFKIKIEYILKYILNFIRKCISFTELDIYK